MIYTARIEQTIAYAKRLRYCPATDSFLEKDVPSLAYEKRFPYPTGWLTESGTPPCAHLDVIVLTDRGCVPGDRIPVRVIGVFLRRDGDHKLVAVPAESPVSDLAALPADIRAALDAYYAAAYTGEGWFGADIAAKVIADYFASPKRKIIITVQHTESEHHVNGMIGARCDWPLTDRGREQAREIGKWLLWEDCDRAFEMYASPQKRAMQTAEEISRILGTAPAADARLCEVDAGAGNGQTRHWYNEHVTPRPSVYDPDYRVFPDAESDRDIWSRIEPFYRMIAENRQERILIVSHGTALSFLQAMLCGIPLEQRGLIRFSGRGGSISKFVIEPSGHTVAEYINHRIF